VSAQNFVARSENSTGINYYIRGQNLKWTMQYNRIVPRNSTEKSGNEMTVQLQLFYS